MIHLIDIPICLLLLSLLLSTAADTCSFSCGDIDIKRPFWLQTDSAKCGSPHHRFSDHGSLEHQLICNDSKLFLNFDSDSRFLVNNISYGGMFPEMDVVNLALKNKSCSLPLVSLPLELVNLIRVSDGSQWACFVSCSRPIKNLRYSNISCLSRNNTFVYAIVDPKSNGCPVEIVEPSCKFLAINLVKSTADMSSTMDIFERLQERFVLSWDTVEFYLSFHKCFEGFLSEISSQDMGTLGALFYSEFAVPSCLVLYFPGNYFFSFFVSSIAVLTWIVQILALMRFIFAPLSIYIFLAYKLWRTRISVNDVEKFLRNQQPLTPLRYSYTDLIAVTGHFREKIGQGGFGTVFKGTLLSGHHLAIKMLGNSKLNGDEFINEVSTVGRIHHINVVQLVGFCSEGSKRALVYEYMPNGSLDKYIFSAKGTSHRPFTWEKLNDIALGIARGIDYLHRGCDMQILHFDIKPHNILLDHNFNPKVSDFGLAKLYPKDYSLVSLSAARGTIGYIAPELVSRSFGVISYKSDVYSFGMLLLEMAGGRRNVDTKMENSSKIYYPSWIYDRIMQGEQLVVQNSNEIHEVERKLCMVGLWCIQMKSANRPSMSKVIEMLEGDADSLEMPSRPFFSSSQPDSMRLSSMKSITEQLSNIFEQEYPSDIEA